LNINTNDRRNFKGKCINCSSIIRFKLNDSDENGILEDDSISFAINGVEYQVDNSYAFTTTLNEYLREVLKMTGTKLVCKEGGCGSCTVNAEIYDYDLDQFVNVSLNSVSYL
jgi:xanthine dehydrogenase iron-sulfur cluster and FAD-binding subunit A